MSNDENPRTIILAGNLLLSELSNKEYPDVAAYREIKIVDVHNLSNIDSAGIAYLAQIKSKYIDLDFVGVSDNILVLAHLYGLGFIFKS